MYLTSKIQIPSSKIEAKKTSHLRLEVEHKLSMSWQTSEHKTHKGTQKHNLKTEQYNLTFLGAMWSQFLTCLNTYT